MIHWNATDRTTLKQKKTQIFFRFVSISSVHLSVSEWNIVTDWKWKRWIQPNSQRQANHRRRQQQNDEQLTPRRYLLLPCRRWYKIVRHLHQWQWNPRKIIGKKTKAISSFSFSFIFSRVCPWGWPVPFHWSSKPSVSVGLNRRPFPSPFGRSVWNCSGHRSSTPCTWNASVDGNPGWFQLNIWSASWWSFFPITSTMFSKLRRPQRAISRVRQFVPVRSNSPKTFFQIFIFSPQFSSVSRFSLPHRMFVSTVGPCRCYHGKFDRSRSSSLIPMTFS